MFENQRNFYLRRKKVQTDAHIAGISLFDTQSSVQGTTRCDRSVYHNELVVTRSHVASKVSNLSGVSNLFFLK